LLAIAGTRRPNIKLRGVQFCESVASTEMTAA
jgi:hypothetical protein